MECEDKIIQQHLLNNMQHSYEITIKNTMQNLRGNKSNEVIGETKDRAHKK